MTFFLRKKTIFLSSLFLFFCFACKPQEVNHQAQSIEEKPTPVPVPPEQPQVKPLSSPSLDESSALSKSRPAIVLPSIADLKSSNNRVDFKSKSKSIWEPVTEEMSFFRYDSIQTHQQSTATIRYHSQTELDVKEKTLLVFDEDPGSKKKKIDRVILKTGDLLGRTSSELWVLTDAGLVQISADKLKPAKARVQIKDEQIKVSVDQGQAFLTVKNKNDVIQKISIASNNTISLNTQTQIRNFMDLSESKTVFEDALKLASPKAPATVQTVVLESAEETETVKADVFQLKGKLSAVGAKLIINGELIQTNADLSFSKDVALAKGSNLIVIQLIRSDSTSQFIRKKVVRDD